MRHVPVAGLAALSVTLLCTGAAGGPVRQVADERDLQEMQGAQPAAYRAFVQGEEALRQGNASGAASAFYEASAAAPDNALAARRYCEALTNLGRRQDALDACRKAMSNRGSPMDLRAMVGALTSGKEPMNSDDLLQAASFARRASDTLPRQPYGYAAQCDIAYRIGDDRLLQGCLAKLERIAPEHYETARARSMVLARSRHPGRSLGWVALGAAFLGTAWDALRRRRRRAAGPAAVAAIALVASLTAARPAAAQEANAATEGANPSAQGTNARRWLVDDADPEKGVPTEADGTRDPFQFGAFLFDLTERADGALAKHEYAAAAKYYRALTKSVPSSAVPFGQLCEAYEGAGNRELAIESCREALSKKGVRLTDYTRFAGLVLGREGKLRPADVEDVDAIAAHLSETEATRTAGLQVACELGMRLQDEPRLTECTAALRTIAPEDPKTIVYQWALALRKGNLPEAEQLVERARHSSMGTEGVQKMEQDTLAAKRPVVVRLFGEHWLFWAVGIVTAAVTLLLRRRSVAVL